MIKTLLSRTDMHRLVCIIINYLIKYLIYSHKTSDIKSWLARSKEAQIVFFRRKFVLPISLYINIQKHKSTHFSPYR